MFPPDCFHFVCLYINSYSSLPVSTKKVSAQEDNPSVSHPGHVPCEATRLSHHTVKEHLVWGGGLGFHARVKAVTGLHGRDDGHVRNRKIGCLLFLVVIDPCSPRKEASRTRTSCPSSWAGR